MSHEIQDEVQKYADEVVRSVRWRTNVKLPASIQSAISSRAPTTQGRSGGS